MGEENSGEFSQEQTDTEILYRQGYAREIDRTMRRFAIHRAASRVASFMLHLTSLSGFEREYFDVP